MSASEPTTSAASVKHDAGKAPLHLLDPMFLLETAKVLDFGQQKYGAWNWAKGTFDWSRLYSAHQRHMMAFWNGEETDEETGLPHLAHAACCLMFLLRYAQDGMGQDDRGPFTQRGKPTPPAPTLAPVAPLFGSGKSVTEMLEAMRAQPANAASA